MKFKLSTLRKIKYGSLATVITVSFLLVIVLLNVFVQLASQRMPLSMDLSSEKAYGISKQSVEYLRTVEDPVTITVLVDKMLLENAGGYYLQAKEIIDQYPKHSSKIEVQYLDPVVNPGFVAQYPDLALKELDILVTCGEKQAKTSLASLFTVVASQSTGEQYIKSSCAEQEMTSAILRVTTKVEEKIVLLTGQDEMYTNAFTNLLTSAGYIVEETNLLTEELDSDAKIVCLLAPRRDLDENLLKKLDDYLMNNGEYGRTLIFAPHPSADSLPNLEAYLAQWGIAIGRDIVVESEPSRFANNLPYICLVDYATNEFKDKLTTAAPYMSILGRNIWTRFESQSVYETDVLLKYGESAYAMPVNGDSEVKQEWDSVKVWPALIRSTYSAYSGTTRMESRILVFASASSFDTQALGSGSTSNKQYIMALFGNLTDRKDTVTVPSVELKNPALGLTQEQYTEYALLFTAVLPLVTLAAGMFVWFKRRHL